mmetsp:Transcript_28383/g.90333  ORF Transcript_28383/g.90333 Transcript_28383/m.90333 type:complete len:263 (+) Transcript_28383:202-990(+)
MSIRDAWFAAGGAREASAPMDSLSSMSRSAASSTMRPRMTSSSSVMTSGERMPPDSGCHGDPASWAPCWLGRGTCKGPPSPALLPSTGNPAFMAGAKPGVKPGVKVGASARIDGLCWMLVWSAPQKAQKRCVGPHSLLQDRHKRRCTTGEAPCTAGQPAPMPAAGIQSPLRMPTLPVSWPRGMLPAPPPPPPLQPPQPRPPPLLDSLPEPAPLLPFPPPLPFPAAFICDAPGIAATWLPSEVGRRKRGLYCGSSACATRVEA